MAYVTPAEFLERYDERVIGDLASVDGTPVSPGALLSDSRLAAALLDAEGEVNSAAHVAARYTSTQLAALTGAGAAHLKRIVSDIGFFLMIDRRILNVSTDERDYRRKVYKDILDDLRKGIALFDIEEAKEAGLPSVTGPTTAQADSMYYITGRARGHFFPNRVLPNGR